MEIKKALLNAAVKRHIKNHEKELNKKCYKLWSFTNPNNETFLFGRFGKYTEDETIVTIAVENLHVCGGWEPQWN